MLCDVVLLKRTGNLSRSLFKFFLKVNVSFIGQLCLNHIRFNCFDILCFSLWIYLETACIRSPRAQKCIVAYLVAYCSRHRENVLIMV